MDRGRTHVGHLQPTFLLLYLNLDTLLLCPPGVSPILGLFLQMGKTIHSLRTRNERVRVGVKVQKVGVGKGVLEVGPYFSLSRGGCPSGG